jgi:hypothetical protein
MRGVQIVLYGTVHKLKMRSIIWENLKIRRNRNRLFKAYFILSTGAYTSEYGYFKKRLKRCLNSLKLFREVLYIVQFDNIKPFDI